MRLGLGLHVGLVEKRGSGDHGGSRAWGRCRSQGFAAPEALLSATCSLQPYGGPYTALVSEQGRGR